MEAHDRAGVLKETRMSDITLLVESTRVSQLADPDTMRNRVLTPMLRRGLEIWETVRAGAPRPDRADIDPLILRPILSHVMLWEVVSAPLGREFVVRIAGEDAAVRRGGRLKGHTLIDFHADRYEPIWKEFDQVRRTGQLHYCERTAQWVDCPFYYFYRLLMPIGTPDTVTHLLSVIEYEKVLNS